MKEQLLPPIFGLKDCIIYAPAEEFSEIRVFIQMNSLDWRKSLLKNIPTAY